MQKRVILSTWVAGAILASCGSDSDTVQSIISYADKVASRGVTLPYSALDATIEDGAKPGSTMEIRNGGFGSAATAHPTNINQFYVLTDRGPNADYAGNEGKGKMFPTPDYTPKIGLFEIQADGSIKKIQEIVFKDREGKVISGLPNRKGLGGTGELPYDKNGNIIRLDMTKAYDDNESSPTYNPLKLDDYGLDSEGLVALKDGTFWVSDEYGPHMVHFDANGKEIGRINAFDDARNVCKLPAEFGKRWANRGMEGLAITPDEKTLVGIMQSTLDNPSKAVRSNLTRIVTVNLENCSNKQYLYKQEKNSNSNSEIVALDSDTFLVIERDGAFYNATPTAQKQVYKIKLSTGSELESVNLSEGMAQDASLGLTIDSKTLEQVVADNNYSWDMLSAKGIHPVEKSLVVDMVEKVQYPHDKMEGLIVFNNTTLGVLNDDDFATWATDNVLEQKYLDEAQTKIDGNTLYIINNLDLSTN